MNLPCEKPMEGVITIDGPAGSGKSTVSILLAKQLGFLYLDTGAMYRAVALQAKREGVGPEDGEALGDLCRNLELRFEEGEMGLRLYMEEEDISSAIRSPEMDMLSSTVSAVGEVREAMTELQRKMGSRGRVVAEGRDMGTVVFPNAIHKFFLTASTRVRAERRYRERIERGENVTLTEVEEALIKRDEQDSTRNIAPLRPAGDAIIIDTDTMNIEQVIQTIRDTVRIENL